MSQLTLLREKIKKEDSKPINSERKENGKRGLFIHKKRGMKSMKDLLEKWKFDPEREKSQIYVKHEFQDYGVRLAHKLNDPQHKSLYIKLAKTEKRANLEQAYQFAIDYPEMKGKNKGKLFMWALAKLRKGELLHDQKDKIVTK